MASSKSANATALREEHFVASIVAGRSATGAAEDAGYSKKTAYSRGNELLKRPRVIQAIAAAKTRILKKYHVSAERIVEEMAVIGFSDLRHYTLGVDGNLTLAPNAPDSAMRAVKRFKRKLRTIPQVGGLPPIVEIDSEFELWSKDTELRNLGDYKKLFKENRADDDVDGDLTNAQRKERIVSVLRNANERRKRALGATPKPPKSKGKK